MSTGLTSMSTRQLRSLRVACRRLIDRYPDSGDRDTLTRKLKAVQAELGKRGES